MSQFPNLLLNSLSAADGAALRPHLRAVDLPQGEILFDVGAPILQVYFLHSGIVSLVVSLASGETIESAMIGRESVVGGSAGLNGQESVYKAIVQIAGTASVLDSDRLRRAGLRISANERGLAVLNLWTLDVPRVSRRPLKLPTSGRSHIGQAGPGAPGRHFASQLFDSRGV